jgi:murein L,D-transpeptidase YafK
MSRQRIAISTVPVRAICIALLIGLVAAPALANDLRPVSLVTDADRPRSVDAIMVYKGQRTLSLIRHGEILEEFPIALGGEPVGHKTREGDERTPEGRYFIDWRNPGSRFYKALHISYPNVLDRYRAELEGVSPGGMVMIHGAPTAPELRWMDTRGDWTDGCIAVSNHAMDRIWRLVHDGTLVIIKP